MRIAAGSRGVARLDPRRRFLQFLGNFAQKLRRPLFCFRRDFFLDEAFHALQFFIHVFSEALKIIDSLQTGNLLINLAAKFFEGVHERAHATPLRGKTP